LIFSMDFAPTLLDERDALLQLHVGAIVLPNESVDEAGSGTAYGAGLAGEHAAQGDAVHLSTTLCIPASHNDTGEQGLAVAVAIVAELGGGLEDQGLLVGLILMVVQFRHNKQKQTF